MSEHRGPAGYMPPRLVWLNGPYSSGKRTLAGFLRANWGATVFDAEAVGEVVQRGMPAGLDVGDLADLPVWRLSVVGIGTELAHAGSGWPFVAMPTTLGHAERVAEILDRFERAGVEVVHVVLDAHEAILRARIHERPLDRDAKRWRLEHLHSAVAELGELRDTVRLDTTSQTPDRLAADLAATLHGRGWLTAAGEWTVGMRR